MGTSGTELNHNQVHVGDERLGVIHSGSRYVLGFGRDYFGIWEQGAPGGPAQRFPATQHGREEAWQRYVELEPSAQQVREAQMVIEEEAAEVRRGWTRRRLIMVGILAAAVILAVVLTQLHKSGTKTVGGGQQANGNTAHIDVSGGATVTEDMKQQSFEVTGFGGLFPKIEATWKGPSVTMHLSLNVPNLGTNTTNENPFRVLDFVIAGTAQASPTASAKGSPAASPAAGGQTKFLSLTGECTMNLKSLEKDGISGTFDCTGVPALTSSTTTIDAKGSFSAQT
jgi:hypothetical protein